MKKPQAIVRALAIASAVLLAGCAIAPPQPRNPLAIWVPSLNYNARQPTLIVLHFTGEHSALRALEVLRSRNSGGPVSAHYLIGRDGTLYQLVAENARAWHAGVSQWGDSEDVNSESIGIELDNDGEEPFAQPQMDSLLRLLADITARLDIPRTHVVGHS
ncbi:MAG TPA: N-acetylmuramoyl-L-alanine amidase, partial [Rhodanobacteraceae bacterium]